MLSSISDSAQPCLSRGPVDRNRPYERAVIHASVPLYKREFERFSKSKDARTKITTPDGVKKIGGHEKQYLSMHAASVTPNFLASNVIGEAQREFEAKIPYIWNLFSECTSDSAKNHINTLALGLLFNARMCTNNRIQIMLGSYLLANGARPKVLAQLSRFGLCVGPRGLQNVFATLAEHQRAILQHAGKPTPVELHLVYDNVQRDGPGLSDVVREARDRLRRESEGPTSGFMALSIGGVIGVGGVELPVDPSIWETSSNSETPSDVDEA